MAAGMSRQPLAASAHSRRRFMSAGLAHTYYLCKARPCDGGHYCCEACVQTVPIPAVWLYDRSRRLAWWRCSAGAEATQRRISPRARTRSAPPRCASCARCRRRLRPRVPARRAEGVPARVPAGGVPARRAEGVPARVPAGGGQPGVERLGWPSRPTWRGRCRSSRPRPYRSCDCAGRVRSAPQRAELDRYLSALRATSRPTGSSRMPRSASDGAALARAESALRSNDSATLAVAYGILSCGAPGATIR